MLLTLCFLFILLGYSIFCFYRKQPIFNLLGALLWFLFSMNEYFYSTGWDIHRGFALFGALLFFIMLLAPLYLRPKSLGEEEEEPESGIDRYIRRRGRIKEAARKIKGEKEYWEE